MKDVETAPRWFYTRDGAKNYGDLQDVDYEVVAIQACAPTPEDLLLYLLAYRTKEKILQSVEENCYGCQHDRPSQTEHQCLAAWEEHVEEYYELNVVKMSSVTEDLNKLSYILGVSYNWVLCCFDCRD